MESSYSTGLINTGEILEMILINYEEYKLAIF